MNIEAFFKNQDVKKFAKWGGGVVLTIWIIREIFMMTMFHSMFTFVTGGINSQEAAMKSMQGRSEQHMQEVEAGMQKVTQGMSDRADEMIQKLDKFKKDFAKSDEVVEALKHARENQEKFSNEVSQYMHEKIAQSAIDAEKESKAFVDRIAQEENKINKQRSMEQTKGLVKKESDASEQTNAVRTTINRARDKALMVPSDDNVKDYLSLQNQLVTQSGEFSNKGKEK